MVFGRVLSVASSSDLLRTTGFFLPVQEVEIILLEDKVVIQKVRIGTVALTTSMCLLTP